MIKDDSKRASFIGISPIRFSCPIFKFFTHVLEQIDLEHVRIIIQCGGDPLQPSAEVDILLFETLESVRSLEVLHEDVIADLQEPPAVAVHMAGPVLPLRLLMQATVRAEIPEHLGVRPAGLTDRHFLGFSRPAPPVLLLTVVEDTPVLHPAFFGVIHRARVDADGRKLLLPIFDRLVIAGNLVFAAEDRHVQSRRIQSQFFREKFKHPGNLLLFEVISQTPVSEHFEEGRMSIVADFFDIHGPETFLTVGDSFSQRMRFAEQVGEHRLHARTGEERCRIIFWKQRRARDHGMVLRPEEVEVGLADVVGALWGHADGVYQSLTFRAR